MIQQCLSHQLDRHSDQQMSPQSLLRFFDGLFGPMRIVRLQMDHFQDFLRFRNLTVEQFRSMERWKKGGRKG